MVSKNTLPLQAEAPQAPKASGASGAGAASRSVVPAVRVPVLLMCSAEEDRAKQAFKDECDINVLMRRYEKTGVLPLGRGQAPVYVDASVIDFQASMDRVAQVRGVFSLLDARTRARFENNPEFMLEFLADPANKEEAVKLGLLPPDPKPAAAAPAAAAEVVPEPSVSEQVQTPAGDVKAGQEA